MECSDIGTNHNIQNVLCEIATTGEACQSVTVQWLEIMVTYKWYLDHLEPMKDPKFWMSEVGAFANCGGFRV